MNIRTLFRSKIANSNLLKNIFYLFIMQGLNMFLPFLLYPILIRRVGLEYFGLASLQQSIAMFFIFISDWGYSYSATRSIAKNAGNTVEIQKMISEVFSTKITLLLWGLPIFIIVMSIMYNDKWNSFYLNYSIINYFYIIFTSLTPVWFFQGIQDMKKPTHLSLVVRLIVFAITIFIIKSPSDLLYFPLFQTIGVGISVFILLFLIKFKYSFNIGIDLNVITVLTSLRENKEFAISNIAMKILSQSGLIIMGLFKVPPLIVGQFSVVDKYISALKATYIPIGTALYPYISQKISSDRENGVKTSLKATISISTLYFVLAIILSLNVKTIAALFGISPTQDVKTAFMIGSFIPIMTSIGSINNLATLHGLGKEKYSSMVFMVASVVNVVFMSIAIHLRGIVPPVVVILGTEFFIALCGFSLVRRHKSSENRYQ